MMRWIGWVACTLAGAAGAWYGWQFGRQIGGPVSGVIVGVLAGANCGALCALTASALLDRVQRWTRQRS